MDDHDHDDVELYLITGIMAAGKSTVAQGLAERFGRSAHVRGDRFRRSIVSGREEMSPQPSAEAMAQLLLRYRLAAAVADGYVEAGFTTVVQDTIVGSVLADAVAGFRTRPLALIVLAPSAEAVARRERDRAKVGYRSFTPHAFDRLLRDETPRIGLWLDSTELDPAGTVDAILDRRAEALIR